MNNCDGCGSPRGYLSMGGAMICRDCEPDIRQEMESLRAAGKPVNVRHIAKRMFRETHSAGTYLLRDIPDDLWAQAKHRAIEENISLRDLILTAVRKYVA